MKINFQLINKFTEYAREMEWNIQSCAEGECGTICKCAKYFFYLYGNFKEIEIVNMKYIGELEEGGNPNHYMVLIDGLYYDWAARQFDRCADFPTVYTYEELITDDWEVQK